MELDTLRRTRYSLAIGNLNKWSTDMVDLNRMVKDLGLNQLSRSSWRTKQSGYRRKRSADRAKEFEPDERAWRSHPVSDDLRMRVQWAFLIALKCRDRR